MSEAQEAQAREALARTKPCSGCGAPVSKPCRAIVVEGGAAERPVVAAHEVRLAAAQQDLPVREGALARDVEER